MIDPDFARGFFIGVACVAVWIVGSYLLTVFA
jgi:hypothetical protein